MTDTNYWVLPDGISEALPDEAETMEALRRQLLDTYQRWGYRFVMPPLVEYMDSLRTGVGTVLDLQTFKFSDSLSDRQLGIRADTTPQVARIDAHGLKSKHPNRLCYAGHILRTKSLHFEGSRSPLQIGAELFGHAGIESDYELISLMLETLSIAGIDDVVLDLGHVDVFRGLSVQAGLSQKEESQFFDMLERKSIPEIATWTQSANLPVAMAKMLSALPSLNGSSTILQEAQTALAAADRDVKLALDYLVALSQRIQDNWPQVTLHLDLSELRGYTYHTGIVYAAYVPQSGHEVARGGRYDDIGKHFGNARPATGFSTNVGSLLKMGNYQQQKQSPILAPCKNDSALNTFIKQLRDQGEQVICQLDGQTEYDCKNLNCNRKIVLNDGTWAVINR
jgi:ATP phosphoribosyltransferase regulatory subunit